MQLTLTHNDVTKALCLYLQTQGMTAFDPNVVTAEFAFKRGSKELTCTLDTEAPVAVVAEAPKPSAEIPAATTSASVAEVPETAPAVAAETPAEPASTQVAEAVATTAETQELATAGGDDDNLFD
jgi:hypothetical protein